MALASTERYPGDLRYAFGLPGRVRRRLAVRRLFRGSRGEQDQTGLLQSVQTGYYAPLYSLDTRRVDYPLARALFANTHNSYKLGAGFAKPIVNTMAGFIGIPHFSHEIEEVDQVLTAQMARWRATLLRVNRNALRDGDVFVRIHKVQDRIDRRRQTFRLQIITPDWVTPNIDPITSDWRSVIIRYPIPAYDQYGRLTGQTYQAVETITPDTRKVVVEGAVPDELRQQLSADEGNNWGVIPIVHFKNEPEDNQLFGRSDLESLEPFFKAYHDTVMSAIQGSRLFSRPKVKFKLADVDRFLRENFSAEQVRSGKLQFQGRDIFLMQANDDASFITADAGAAGYQILLELIFYCIIQNSGTPEFILGTAVASSKASVQEQMPPFIKHVERKRYGMEDPYRELAGLFLNMWATSENQDLGSYDVEMGWPEVTPRDEIQMANTINVLVSAFSLAVTSGFMSVPAASGFLREYIPTMLPWLDSDGTDDERRRVIESRQFQSQLESDLAALTRDAGGAGDPNPDAGGGTGGGA